MPPFSCRFVIDFLVYIPCRFKSEEKVWSQTSRSEIEAQHAERLLVLRHQGQVSLLCRQLVVDYPAFLGVTLEHFLVCGSIHLEFALYRLNSLENHIRWFTTLRAKMEWWCVFQDAWAHLPHRLHRVGSWGQDDHTEFLILGNFGNISEFWKIFSRREHSIWMSLPSLQACVFLAWKSRFQSSDYPGRQSANHFLCRVMAAKALELRDNNPNCMDPTWFRNKVYNLFIRVGCYYPWEGAPAQKTAEIEIETSIKTFQPNIRKISRYCNVSLI